MVAFLNPLQMICTFKEEHLLIRIIVCRCQVFRRVNNGLKMCRQVGKSRSLGPASLQGALMHCCFFYFILEHFQVFLDHRKGTPKPRLRMKQVYIPSFNRRFLSLFRTYDLVLGQGSPLQTGHLWVAKMPWNSGSQTAKFLYVSVKKKRHWPLLPFNFVKSGHEK